MRLMISRLQQQCGTRVHAACYVRVSTFSSSSGRHAHSWLQKVTLKSRKTSLSLWESAPISNNVLEDNAESQAAPGNSSLWAIVTPDLPANEMSVLLGNQTSRSDVNPEDTGLLSAGFRVSGPVSRLARPLIVSLSSGSLEGQRVEEEFFID